MAANAVTETKVRVYGATAAANLVNAHLVAAKAEARKAYHRTKNGMGGTEAGRKALSEYVKVFGLLNDAMTAMEVAEHWCEEASAKVDAL